MLVATGVASAAVKRRKAGAPRFWRAAAQAYARTMDGMRLSALRSPLAAGGESILVVVCKTRARERVAGMIFYFAIASLPRPTSCARRWRRWSIWCGDFGRCCRPPC